MKTSKVRLAATFLMLVTWLAMTGAEAADPVGTWLRPSTGSHVQLFRCGGSICGRITAARDPARQANVGKVILSGAKQTNDNIWEGELFNPDDGSTYSGLLSLTGTNTIRLEGCTLQKLVCKGESWTRVR